MPERFAKMQLEASPWVGKHDRQAVDNYIAWYRGLASAIADMMEIKESKSYDSYISDALESLTSFNITTHASRKIRQSTFRFSELKEGERPTTVFIMLDANKAKAQAPVMGLLQWCMSYEIKKHKNKKREVFVIADECCRIPWSDIGGLMTFARGFGLRLMFIFQNYADFEKSFGKQALEILKSESEIALMLPGQRNDATLRELQEKLGESSLITKNHNTNKHDGMGISGTSYSETGRPVMTADELRRLKDKGILFVRNNKPLLVDLPSISEIAPWRSLVAGNPHHDFKPFLKRVKLRVGNRNGGLLRRLWVHLFRKGGAS